MKKIWCDCCQSHQPLIEEPVTHIDKATGSRWGDLLCGTCHLVIATVSEWPEEDASERDPSDARGGALQDRADILMRITLLQAQLGIEKVRLIALEGHLSDDALRGVEMLQDVAKVRP